MPEPAPETGSSKLEHELEKLLDIGSFDPPAGFQPHVQPPAAPATDRAALADFWAEQARELIDWAEPFSEVLDDSNPPFYKWFADGKLNVSYNCLDRHVEAGRGDRVAYHWHGEEGEQRAVTYDDLLSDVQKLANGLKSLGVESEDVVGIYLPMIPEVVVAMLACARIGAVHNVVFGGFSVASVTERMEVSEAKVLITVDGARRKGKTAAIKSAVDAEIGEVVSLQHIVVVRATGIECPMQDGRDVFYDELCARVDPVCEPVALGAEHPLFILYSSGSTAKPKGILHTTGGYLTGVIYSHRLVFDLDPDTDIYWCAADVGWITGHSYIVYGPLANGATSVMWEGAPDYPDKDIWWSLIEHYKVTILYTAPTAIRACMKWGAEYPERHDLSSLRVLGSVGEPINPKAWLWYYKVIGGERCPIVDTWWQTETGSIVISPLPGVTRTKPGSATHPLPGYSPKLVSEDGEPLESGTGVLVIDQPWPSMLRTLYRDDERFIETYFARFGKETYLVGDAAQVDSEGYHWIIGRIDDVINVSGHRLSTAEVESALVSHEAVAEAAVVGQADEDTGQSIVAFVTLGGGREGDDATVEALRDHVATKIGKFSRPKRIIWADDLPKTRSGKIMRRLLRDIAEGRELGDVTTLRDPDVMSALSAKIDEHQAKEE
jgi:acetyl-CoA synthetase